MEKREFKPTNEKTIGEIAKKKGSIKVRTYEFGDRKYVDIRNFNTNEKNVSIPTVKGIAIPTDKLTEIITFLEKIESEIGVKS